MGDDPVEVKFEVDPSAKTAELYIFRLITAESYHIAMKIQLK